MADYGLASNQMNQSTAYAGEMAKNAYNEGPIGLVRLAEQVSENAARIDSIAHKLQQVSIGIHGPRPEPAQGDRVNGAAPSADSLASRVQMMTDAVNHLQRVYDSLVR